MHAIHHPFSFFTLMIFSIPLLTGCTACTQIAPSGESVKTTSVSVKRQPRDTVKKIGRATLRVANWNTETFFDSVTTGNEYSEFVKSKQWGKEAYVERLKRLCSVIKSLDADVFVMEEIENEGVMYDISNFLAGEWDSRKQYKYGCFAKDEDSSIGCGIISRYPLSNITTHALNVQSENEAMPALRPLIEVTVSKDGESLVLLANHWKSKSGGTEETEKWRDWQEEILGQVMGRLVAEGASVIACGDFNRDIDDFKRSATADTAKQTIVMRAYAGEMHDEQTDSTGTQSATEVEAASPWYEGNTLVEPGSYYFNGSWERIDNFFIAGNAECISFCPETDGPWCDKETKTPQKYELWNGYGYSDHLPISCTVRF